MKLLTEDSNAPPAWRVLLRMWELDRLPATVEIIAVALMLIGLIAAMCAMSGGK